MTRLSRSPSLPAALLLAGGAVALLAFFALPWYTRICPPYFVQEDPTCPVRAAATPYIPGDSLGPWGNNAQHAPLDRYLAFEALYLGPSLLGLVAGVVALVKRRSGVLRVASGALAASGACIGFFMALVLEMGAGNDYVYLHQWAIGFFLTLAGYGAIFFGSIYLIAPDSGQRLSSRRHAQRPVS